MNLLNVGGTLTGGSTVAYTPAGVSPGRSVFVGPDHSRNAIDQISLSTSATPGNTKTGVPGISRGGTQMRRSKSVTSEGCCTAAVSLVQFDTQAQCNSNASDADVDAAIDLYRALVYTAAWKAMVKQMILPSA